MCKQATFSKYQKSVIKFLNELLGTQIPFTYEKTQNNHLKVLIEGLDKPLYTSSTPSDTKSLDNFMSHVKRELKAIEVLTSNLANTSIKATPQSPSIKSMFQPNFEKLIQTCIKSLRTRVDSIKQQEQDKVLETNDIDFIKDERLKIVKASISHTLQNQRQANYIKPKAMKEIESSILRHLNFMLPTMAFYSDLLVENTTIEQAESDISIISKSINKPVRELSKGQQALPEIKQEQVIPTTKAQIAHDGQSKKLTGLTQLLQLSTQNRVNAFRTMTSDQAHELISNIEQAMTLNREQDIEAVVAMIRQKSIPLEAIITRLEVA